jgi:hypothetical protein
LGHKICKARTSLFLFPWATNIMQENVSGSILELGQNGENDEIQNTVLSPSPTMFKSLARVCCLRPCSPHTTLRPCLEQRKSIRIRKDRIPIEKISKCHLEQRNRKLRFL